MPSRGRELLHGTLELLLLRLLEDQPANGYAIGQRIEELTDDALKVDEGSLYPALYRLERRGFVQSYWGTTENNRRAKFYRITRSGRRRLDSQRAEWAGFQTAVQKSWARREDTSTLAPRSRRLVDGRGGDRRRDSAPPRSAGPRLPRARIFRGGSPWARSEAIRRRSPREAGMPAPPHGRAHERRTFPDEHPGSRAALRGSLAREGERADRDHPRHSGARHRRQHRDLQRRRRRAPPAPAVPGTRSPAEPLGERPAPRHDAGGILASGLRRRPRRTKRFRVDGRVHLPHDHLDFGRR